jgi:hypothetical protein
VQEFLFPASSPAFVVVCVLDDSLSDWSDVNSQCVFDLYFFYDVDHLFMYLLATCTSFENYLFSSFSHLFDELLTVYRVNFLSCLYIMAINFLSDV